MGCIAWTKMWQKLDVLVFYIFFFKKKLIKRISNKIQYMFDFKRVSKYLFSTWANWDQLPRQYFSAIFTETLTNAFLASFFCLQWWPSKLHLQNSINWLSRHILSNESVSISSHKMGAWMWSRMWQNKERKTSIEIGKKRLTSITNARGIFHLYQEHQGQHSILK